MLVLWEVRDGQSVGIKVGALTPTSINKYSAPPPENRSEDAISEYLNHITFSAIRQRCSGANCEAICSATRIPSMAAEVIPPAYPAPSPQG